MSLLGAAAYALLTRVDAAVYIVALQRVAHAPKVIHIRRLNAVTRWMQRNPRKVVLPHMQGPFRMVALSDSAFKKEDDSGHAMRGCVILLVPQHGSLEQDLKRGRVHLVD